MNDEKSFQMIFCRILYFDHFSKGIALFERMFGAKDVSSRFCNGFLLRKSQIGRKKGYTYLEILVK